MKSFVVSDSCKYVCTGPISAAVNAQEKIKSGARGPDCWDKPPSTQIGGTVLVHNVDQRVPAVAGKWHVARLFNRNHDVVCGGMVWSDSIGSSPAAAAELLKKMENAGGAVICNSETPEVLSQKIRFIGRYSWDDTCEREDLNDVMSNSFSVLSGPTCCFATPDAVESVVIPKIREAVAGADAVINAEVERRLAAGETEQYSGEFRAELEYSGFGGTEDKIGLKQFAFPEMVNFDEGVVFTFRGHEYLFGRLWMDGPEGSCTAFCFYTYHSPGSFSEMRVEDSCVSPLLPLHEVVKPDAANPADANHGLRTRLMAEESDVNLGRIFDDMAIPYRNSIYQDAMTDLAFSRRLCQCSWFEITTELLDKLMPGYEYGGFDVEPTRLIIEHTAREVMLKASESEIARFRELDEGLLAGTMDLKGGRAFAYSRGSHLSMFFKHPELMELMFRLGYSARSVLSPTAGEWFRTVLAESALNGLTETVRVLLDAGASVDESVGGDPWNAIVYAVFGGSAATEELFRQRFPEHPVWERTDIPLEIKEMPKGFWFAGEEGEDGEGSPPEVGSLADLKRKVKEKEEEMASRSKAMGVFMNFG